jgi:hypothetical protein
MRLLVPSLALALLIAAGNAALAGNGRDFGDTYYTEEDPTAAWEPIPVDPNLPASGWTWPAPPWISVVPPWPTLVIGHGSFRLFGMENFYVPEWHKTIYLSFDFDPTGDALPTLLDVGWGYHPAYGVTSTHGEVVSEVISGNHYSLEYTICPQPDWEVIKLGCVGTVGEIYIVGSSVIFYTECGPPPTPVESSTWGAIKALYR